MFEWDPRKAAANADKHGVTFDEAVTVFLDANAFDGPDLAHSEAEPRDLRLGRAADGACSWWLTRSGDEPTRNDRGDTGQEMAAALKREGRPALYG